MGAMSVGLEDYADPLRVLLLIGILLVPILSGLLRRRLEGAAVLSVAKMGCWLVGIYPILFVTTEAIKVLGVTYGGDAPLYTSLTFACGIAGLYLSWQLVKFGERLGEIEGTASGSKEASAAQAGETIEETGGPGQGVEKPVTDATPRLEPADHRAELPLSSPETNGPGRDETDVQGLQSGPGSGASPTGELVCALTEKGRRLVEFKPPKGSRGGGPLHTKIMKVLYEFYQGKGWYPMVDEGDRKEQAADMVVWEPREHLEKLEDGTCDLLTDPREWKEKPFHVEIEITPRKSKAQLIENYEKARRLGRYVVFAVPTPQDARDTWRILDEIKAPNSSFEVDDVADLLGEGPAPAAEPCADKGASPQ
ncbi:MAG TPA: hypothetical protein VMS77_01095 [Conexivisphaerales archaeon]|nr:hypothetical protein [Conexivisphaerales archaeon]